MSGISAYKESSITTQSRGQLIVMLYDGAAKFLKQAIELIEANDAAGKGLMINRAVEIINELDATLNVEAGGDIAANLRRLYDFMRRHLFKANAKQDADMIKEVVALLEELNAGWRAVVDK